MLKNDLEMDQHIDYGLCQLTAACSALIAIVSLKLPEVIDVATGDDALAIQVVCPGLVDRRMVYILFSILFCEPGHSATKRKNRTSATLCRSVDMLVDKLWKIYRDR